MDKDDALLSEEQIAEWRKSVLDCNCFYDEQYPEINALCDMALQSLRQRDTRAGLLEAVSMLDCEMVSADFARTLERRLKAIDDAKGELPEPVAVWHKADEVAFSARDFSPVAAEHPEEWQYLYGPEVAARLAAAEAENRQLRRLIDKGRESNATELGLSAQVDQYRNAATKLLERADLAESRLKVLTEGLREPTPEMIDAGAYCEGMRQINDWISEMQVVRGRKAEWTAENPPLAQAWKAMSAALLREIK